MKDSVSDRTNSRAQHSRTKKQATPGEHRWNIAHNLVGDFTGTVLTTGLICGLAAARRAPALDTGCPKLLVQPMSGMLRWHPKHRKEMDLRAGVRSCAITKTRQSAPTHHTRWDPSDGERSLADGAIAPWRSSNCCSLASKLFKAVVTEDKCSLSAASKCAARSCNVRTSGSRKVVSAPALAMLIVSERPATRIGSTMLFNGESAETTLLLRPIAQELAPVCEATLPLPPCNRTRLDTCQKDEPEQSCMELQSSANNQTMCYTAHTFFFFDNAFWNSFLVNASTSM